jgi:hypothetical protein
MRVRSRRFFIMGSGAGCPIGETPGWNRVSQVELLRLPQVAVAQR